MSAQSMSLESQYQKKTDKEHILDNPDTYIGSIDTSIGPMYILKDNKIVQEDIEYNPALFKLFDEGIVNCRDHVIRTNQRKTTDPDTEVVTQIHIEIANNRITLTNNGDGIDVEKHPTYQIWIPEMIFAHLRTSTNYNKEEQKTTGGKNGFGFKLVLIWSTWGKIETVDARRKLKYSQVFEKNMDVIHPPTVVACSKKPYTTVSFEPDYKRFGLKELTPMMISLFQRRIYDIAGVTSKEVKVKYNDQAVPVKDFAHYVSLYTEEDKVTESSMDGWTYTVCLSDEFKQVSFVNGIFTNKGGKHVEYIVQQILKKMVALILKKKKIEVKPAIIKEQFTLFLNCTIENPSFDSQTKDYLTTPSTKFGSSCTVSDKFIEKLANMGILSASCEMNELKEKKNSKKSDGNKVKNLRGIPKLVDANYAGTKQSSECMLILCEGDSAKAGIISGLTPSDRNVIGVYPMKGKLLNVRGELLKKINENKEIIEIKKIMGLETGKSYDSVQELRYGKIIFMTDQDLDGSHIKGLCLNLFECLWPSLLRLDRFIGFMNTPILKATKGSKVLSFYNESDYESWKSEGLDGWKLKYYKGLGTSTGAEFKEYFKEKKIVHFCVEEKDDETLDMLFHKKKADLRKEWLSVYDRHLRVDTKAKDISLGEFVNKEMIHFSKYDCDRSIPNLMDGLKVSQRKILYSAFKKNLTQEIKVAQFSGYVSENSGYHHGEASLNGAIVNMAQDFVGSNNIHLFSPNGQFGTRLQGGKDSASERYIFTKLEKITRSIFPKKDDAILTYLDDDGLMVEPIFYAPILPMILVNGTKGIGTGFSTEVHCYNPVQIIHYLIHTLEGIPPNKEFVPYYRGFKGVIERETEKRFLSRGVYTLKKNVVEVTELPIGTWNEDYLLFLDKLVDEGVLKDFTDLSTDKVVHMKLVLAKEMEGDDLVKTLKLYSYLSTSNMNLFNHEERLVHFNEVHEICDYFLEQRLVYYQKRKDHLLKHLREEIQTLQNKHRYIQELLAETLDLRRKTSTQIHDMLLSKSYDKEDQTFHYLTKMSMDSVCEESVEHLKNQYESKQKELDETQSITKEQMWIRELRDLEKML
jgi:DNA topoisomerase-2